MRAFVTGGTGFLGRNLIGQLLKKGYSVRCLVRSPQKAREIPEDVEIVMGDIMDPKTLDPRYFRGIDVVFHVAGLISSYNPSDYFRVNVDGTKNLIKAILESENRVKFIYTSTLASVGPGKDSEPIKESDEPHPVDFYGKSKREAEDYVLLHKNILNASIIRPTAIYGSLDLGFLPLFQVSLKFAFPLIRGCLFSLVHVADVVKLHILAAEKDVKSGEAYHISDGNKYTFEQIYEILNRIAVEVLSRKLRKVDLPREFVIAIANLIRLIPARLSKRLKIIPPDTLVRIAQKNWYCTYEKAERELGFKPDFEAYQGLRQSIMWYWKKTPSVI